jgi:hypothetical protein
VNLSNGKVKLGLFKREEKSLLGGHGGYGAIGEALGAILRSSEEALEILIKPSSPP